MIFNKPADRPFPIPYLIQLLLFWLTIFTLFRIIFIVIHTTSGFRTEFLPAAQSLVAGWRLDLSMISYLIFPSFLLWILHQFIPGKVLYHINSLYHFLILFALSALAVGNFKMYHEWETLLNYSVFYYLADPNEVISFISFFQLFLLIFSGLAFFAFSVFLFKKMVTNFSSVSHIVITKIALVLLIPVVFIITARGGLQLIPINESSAYFSDTPFYNHVATNPLWYFLHSFLEKESTTNPFLFMDSSVAEERNKNLFNIPEEHSDSILTTPKPNIIFIILESWTADIIKSLGGEDNVTPFFDSLRKEGILFTQIYSAGARTEHGLISILSGYPPPPFKSIITIPYKAEKLSSINEILVDDGYNSSLYYGGEIGFVNMKTYLVNTKFKTIIDKNNFEENQLNSKWGAHDEFVFEKQLHDLKMTPEPFFSVLLTLSTHEPFEVPMQTPFNDNTESDQFRKAAFYTDHCLANYFRDAKKEKWYANTLFVLVADHGHRLPKNSDLMLPQSKRIPLLIFGDVLKESVKGKTIDKIANQHDIATTLLNQLHKDPSLFARSKDILNPAVKEFAYYTTDHVLGWITPGQSFLYFYTPKEVRTVTNNFTQEVVNDSLLLDAKAYLQTHYQEYLEF